LQIFNDIGSAERVHLDTVITFEGKQRFLTGRK
jgi:hypothetical protein